MHWGASMAKRKHRQPSSPEHAAAMAHERRRDAAHIASLRAQSDVVVNIAPTGKIASARRLDVFALLHERRGLSQDQLNAARRLEADIAAWKGVDTGHTIGERVQCSSPQGLITDRMIDAGRRVAIGLKDVGAVNRDLLEALLLPQFAGHTLTRWRDTVQRITGETHDHVQAAMIRGACEALARAYVVIDYAKRSGAPKKTA